MTSIFLRRILPYDLIKYFNAGDPPELQVNNIRKLPKPIELKSQMFGDIGNSKRISVKIGPNNSIRLFANQQYEMIGYFLDHKKYPISGTLCQWCRQKIIGKPFSIYLKIERKIFTGEDKKSRIIDIVHAEGRFCTMGCSAAEYERLMDSKNPPLRYAQAWKCMKLIHELQLKARNMPFKPLRANPDFLLLDKNGGPFNDEEFYSARYQFVEMPNIYIIPTSIIYEIVESN